MHENAWKRGCERTSFMLIRNDKAISLASASKFEVDNAFPSGEEMTKGPHNAVKLLFFR